MGSVYTELNDRLREFIAAQHLFFVATAPLATEGHINLSPKGLDSFRILDERTVAYLDLTGSGIETVAHVRENGRIVLMFCAFGGAPKIVRLYGRARVVEPADADWERYSGPFELLPGTRSVIVVALERVADSCGYGVPQYEYVGERMQLTAYAQQKGPEGMEQYKAQNNVFSIDGLPGLRHIVA